MHFEVLVEDESGKRMLDVLVPRIVGPDHTVRVVPYKGIGHIPKGLTGNIDVSKRIILDRLPDLLRVYGKSWQGYASAVIVVCDLDDKCLKAFRAELFALLHTCHSAPDTRFCIAIEEGEAWLLGDPKAIRKAYPKAKKNILQNYENACHMRNLGTVGRSPLFRWCGEAQVPGVPCRRT